MYKKLVFSNHCLGMQKDAIVTITVNDLKRNFMVRFWYIKKSLFTQKQAFLYMLSRLLYLNTCFNIDFVNWVMRYDLF